MSRAVSPEAIKNLDKVAEFANQLMQTKPAFVQAVAAMLASRKLYAASTYEIDALLEKVDFSKEIPKSNDETIEWTEEHKVFLKEILISASVAKACDSFDSGDLLRELVKSVIPWLTRVSGEHTQAQLEQKKKEQEESEKVRLETPIDIGFPIQNKLTTEEPSKISRKLSLLFIGEKPAVRWLMRRVENNLLEFGSGVTKSCQLFAGTSATTLVSELKPPVDVLLVHDISTAYQKLAFMPLLTCVNETQRRLKRLCGEAGALLISALPLDRKLKPNELHLADYEILRMHNLLRAVMTEPVLVDNRPHLRIVVGVEEIAVIPEEEFIEFQTN